MTLVPVLPILGSADYLISQAGNLPSFEDRVCHATINVDNLDEQCALDGLVINQPQELERVDYILNNSFGMLGINSVLLVRRFA